MTSILATFPIEHYRRKEVKGQGAHSTVLHYEKAPRYSSSNTPADVVVKIFDESEKFAAELQHIVKVRIGK